MSKNFNLILKSSLFVLLGLLDVVDFNILSAAPEEGVISEGSAVIKQSIDKTITEITQHTYTAIIDWRSFDLSRGESAEFIQPAANAVTLNRIHSDAITEINGKLKANGNLIIVNQNGVLFGPLSLVDVNGLIVTTSDLSNQQFSQKYAIENVKQDLLEFDKPGNLQSKITNQGKIIANKGLVGLVAPNVINSGIIIARAGKVKLASGTTFALDLYGDDLLKIAVTEDLKSQLVLNHGNIIADGNQIVLSTAAGNAIVNSLIANSGALRAKSLLNKKGEIIVIAEGSNAVANNVRSSKGILKGSSKVVFGGILDVSGVDDKVSGGTIKVSGDTINLLDGTNINASGYSSQNNDTIIVEGESLNSEKTGGDILIGGDYSGQGFTPTAKSLYVSYNVRIFNDSYYSGNAGKCIFWSDETTRFYGKVFARSLGGKEYHLANNNAIIGGNYGDGGFVEISSKVKLYANGYVNLTASNGKFGRYLLDPSQIHVIGSADDTDGDLIESTFTTAYLSKISNQADLLLSADAITLDLQGYSIDVAKNRNLTVNATNSIETISEGKINTVKDQDSFEGGDINFVAERGSIDLGGLTLNANGGDINITAKKGSVSLGNLIARSVVVKALGNASDIMLYKGNKIVAKNANNPLVLVAGGGIKNQNVSGFNPFVLEEKDARWLVYYTVPNNNQNMQQNYLGSYTEGYSSGYDVNSPPKQTGNLLLYVPQLIGNYDSKDIDQPFNRNSRLVTLENLRLAGRDANNYVLVEPYVSGNIGSILPKDLTIMAQAKTKTYGNADPALTYIVDGLASGDDPSIVQGISISTTASPYSQAGIYPINIKGPSNIGNYIVNYLDNTFLILAQTNPISNLMSSSVIDTIYAVLASTTSTSSSTSSMQDSGATIIIVSPAMYADFMSSGDVIGYSSSENDGGVSGLYNLE